MDKEHLLFSNREESKIAILKELGRNEKDFENDINALDLWLKSQKHLPQVTTRNMLEWYVINCKFSIEKCKQKLDMYYTFRTIMPDLFKNKHPKLPHMQRLFDVAVFVPFPTLTENRMRVLLTKFLDTSEDRIWELLVAYGFHLLDLRLREDLCVSNIVVCDMTNFDFSVLVKANLVLLKNMFKAFENGFAGRVHSFHLVNCSSTIIDNTILLFKSVMSAKFGKRILVHKSFEDMHKHITPKEIFPKDYGGTAPSSTELLSLWKQKFEDNFKLFDQLEEIEVNETLRPTPLNNDEILGFYGNFKKLNVD